MSDLAEQGIQFRESAPQDGPELRSLLNRIFGRSFDEHYWNWKYRDNPAGSARTCIAYDDSGIMAHFGGLPMVFRIDGKSSTGVQDVDIAIQAENRTYQGVKQVNRCRQEINDRHNIDFIFGFAIESTAQISRIQYGYEHIGHVPRLLKVVDYRELMKSRQKTKFVSPLGWFINQFDRMRYRVSSGCPAGMKFETIDKFDSRFDQLWEEIRDDYPISAQRDAQYLNWRIRDNPMMVSTTFALIESETNRVVGFVSVGEKQDHVKRGIILDLVTPRSEDGELAKCLISKAVAFFRKQKVAVAVCWMFPHCHLHRPLADAGFQSRLSDQVLVFRNASLKELAISEELALDESNWFIAMSDSDMF